MLFFVVDVCLTLRQTQNEYMCRGRCVTALVLEMNTSNMLIRCERLTKRPNNIEINIK